MEKSQPQLISTAS
jgi:transposase